MERRKLKTLLMHDWLTGFRGGERVFEVFCKMFPDAPILTLLHDPESTGSEAIEQKTIYTSFLQFFPKIEKHYRKFLPLMPTAADMLKAPEGEWDLVLSSSHCVIKGVQRPRGAKHLCYIHSPMRYIYDLFDVYFGAHAPLYQRWGAKVCRPYLTHWDLESNKNVDLFVANSYFVRERLWNVYGHETPCEVVHPFVELDDFSKTPEASKEDYFVMLTAFAPNKRVDLGIEACNRLKLPLKIIGSGQEEERLKKMAGPTIEFLGNVDRKMVIEVLRKGRALIFPGVEDFGITPLESLAAFTPVIAFKVGGVLETLDESVAQFFEEAKVESLEEALKVFMKREHEFKADDLYSRAEQFSKSIFQEKMEEMIGGLL